jgi:hypothetical protein
MMKNPKGIWAIGLSWFRNNFGGRVEEENICCDVFWRGVEYKCMCGKNRVVNVYSMYILIGWLGITIKVFGLI